jgi:death-on-curing protein
MASGGRPGIHKESLIHSAVSRPESYTQYVDSYDLDTICALLIDSIARYHGFNDGNKRTALMTALLTYKLNGVSFRATKKLNLDFEELVLWVVKEKPEIETISEKLKEIKGPHVGGKATLRSLVVSYILTKNPRFKKRDFDNQA